MKWAANSVGSIMDCRTRWLPLMNEPILWADDRQQPMKWANFQLWKHQQINQRENQFWTNLRVLKKRTKKNFLPQIESCESQLCWRSEKGASRTKSEIGCFLASFFFDVRSGWREKMLNSSLSKLFHQQPTKWALSRLEGFESSRNFGVYEFSNVFDDYSKNN